MKPRARRGAAREVARAFDGVARTYGRGRPNLARDLLVARARARLLARLAPGSLICDPACGTGEDAAAFAAAGHRVLALDLSPGMCAVARRRLAPWIRLGAAEVRRADYLAGPRAREIGRCDAVWCHWGTNFTPSLEGFARFCRRALRPGGVAVFTTAGRWPLWEMAAGLARGRPREAFRRLPARGVRLDFGGRPVTAYAPPLGRALAPFRIGFALERAEPLGLLVPPPSLWRPGWRRAAALWRVLDAAEPSLRPLVRLADHALVIVARR